MRIKSTELLGHDGNFPVRLRDLMKEKNISQQTLANVVGVTRQAIAQYMDGRCSQPTMDKLCKMCEYLEVSADYLLGFSDVKSPNADFKAISEKTGLSDCAIEFLTSLKNNKGGGSKDSKNREVILDLINLFLENSRGRDIFDLYNRYGELAVKDIWFDRTVEIKCQVDKKLLDELPDNVKEESQRLVDLIFLPSLDEAKYAIMGQISDKLKTMLDDYFKQKKNSQNHK